MDVDVTKAAIVLFGFYLSYLAVTTEEIPYSAVATAQIITVAYGFSCFSAAATEETMADAFSKNPYNKRHSKRGCKKTALESKR